MVFTLRVVRKSNITTKTFPIKRDLLRYVSGLKVNYIGRHNQTYTVYVLSS